MPEEGKRSIFFFKKRKCTVIAFWFLGLCNNIGYVVMLAAAHDILKEVDERKEERKDFVRECTDLGTGVILLFNIVPTILMKLAGPFLPLMVRLRMACVIALAALGLVLVGLHLFDWMVFLGVALTALSCGLGETTLLGYMVFFRTYNVISTWSSGTGGAGIFGTGIYLLLTSVANLDSRTTIFLMLVVPLIQAVSFYLFTDHPSIDRLASESDEHEVPAMSDQMTLGEKLKIMPKLLRYYMAPFGLVYLFEYFINQGLFELMYFPKAFLSLEDQYRVYQTLYQLGVFISRSSMNLIQINHLWLLAGIQFLNVLFLLAEIKWGFIHYLVIIFFPILWEGFIGGSSYVNTYRRIAQEFPVKEKQFCMAINGLADATMITLAGIIAVPVHDKLCTLEKNYEY